MNCGSTLRQGLFWSSGVEHRKCSTRVSKDRERVSPNLESGFLEPVQREDWEEPLGFLGALSLGTGRTQGKLTRGMKATEALTFFNSLFFQCPVSLQ